MKTNLKKKENRVFNPSGELINAAESLLQVQCVIEKYAQGYNIEDARRESLIKACNEIDAINFVIRNVLWDDFITTIREK